MADDKKEDLVIDDWDSLPLDPNADDWDDNPPVPPAQQADVDADWNLPPAVEDADTLAAPPLADQALDVSGNQEAASFSSSSSSGGADKPVTNASPDQPTADDVFPENIQIDIPASVIDDLDSEPVPTANNLNNNSTDAAAPAAFDSHLSSAENHSSENADAAQAPTPITISLEEEIAAASKISPADQPQPEEEAPVQEAGSNNNSEENTSTAIADPIDISAQSEEKSPGGDNAENKDILAAIDIESSAKKVELDIDGIFLNKDSEDGQGEPSPESKPEETAPPPEEPAAVAEPAAAPPPEDSKKLHIPHFKKLIIIVPAVLLLLIIGIVVYKVFLSKPKALPQQTSPLIIDTNIIPREVQPGEMDLKSIYVDFPGKPEDIIIEMSVTIYYNDLPDKLLLEEKMPAVRDIIYRITQSHGSGLITDAQLQKDLREALVERCNAILGYNGVTYVQISQMRILK